MADPLARAVTFAERALERVASFGAEVGGDAVSLLEERTRRSGRRAEHGISAGGSCRLLPTADGWCAVNLPRTDDLELLPAWLGVDASEEVPWDAIAAAMTSRTLDAVVVAGQELGLAVAALPGDDADEQLAFRGTTAPARPWLVRRVGEPVAARSLDGLRVVDLSSLWAGPLCARLLGRAGASVVKVESTTRPDGARSGDPEFWSAMLDGHDEVTLDFTTDAGREALRAMVREADIVLEQSRPRALERLGIVPAEFVAGRPGQVWLSITAYGRCGPWRDRVGFGDDAAAAGGLVDRAAHGAPLFVGDAIADPLTGIVAAALVAGAVQAGGAMTVDVCLREVARSAAAGARVVW